MTDQRPTPEQLAEWLDAGISEIEGCGGMYVAEQFLDRLETEGYVIVHPDDFPEREVEWKCCDYLNGINEGWNDLRYSIFGDDA